MKWLNFGAWQLLEAAVWNHFWTVASDPCLVFALGYNICLPCFEVRCIYVMDIFASANGIRVDYKGGQVRSM
jgi:hypothetical protein